MTNQTLSSVHSEASAEKQRVYTFARERCALSAMVIYAQLWIDFSLYLYDHVSTPGWISLLLIVPYAAAMLCMAKYLLFHTSGCDDPIVFAAGEKASRLFFILLSISPLFDGFISFYALCALIRDVMPDLSAWEGALAVAFTCAYSLSGKKERALPHLGSFLKWIVGILLLYCFLIAIPHGKASHFFPLMGNGIHSILKGSLWMCGSLSAAIWPLISAEPAEQMMYKQKASFGFSSVLIAILFALITYGVSIWLLPYYAMARPQALGWRLLLVTHMTPSIPAWSLEVIALLLLLMLSLSISTAYAAVTLTKQFIIYAAPWRGALSFLLTAILCLLCIIRTHGRRIREEKA